MLLIVVQGSDRLASTQALAPLLDRNVKVGALSLLNHPTFVH
jgi:hypothetical protein